MTDSSPLVSATRSDSCLQQLTSALVAGTISAAEFADRSDAALNARTRQELEPLTYDLDQQDASMSAVRAPAGVFITSVDALIAAVFAAVTAVVCFGLLGPIIHVGGVDLLWLLSLLCGGVGSAVRKPSLKISGDCPGFGSTGPGPDR